MNAPPTDQEILRAPTRKASRLKFLGRHRWFVVFVGLPTLLAILYYGLIASDVYISQSRFVIKTPGQKGMQTTTLASLIQTTGFSSGKDQTQEVIEYIQSRDALKALERRVNVRQRYSQRDADFLSRFPEIFRDTSFENLYRYYGKKVNAEIDAESGMAVLEVRAFRPEDAFLINAQLLDLSETLINRLNQRAEGRAIAEAERRVTIAEDRVRNARSQMAEFRDRQEIVDPAKQATAALEISNELIAEQAALRSQLSLISRAAPRHPAIPALRSRIAAIGQQIDAQSGRAVGGTNNIASKLSRFQQLELEQEFGTQTLTAATGSLEQARTEAQKQQFYLERVVEPNKPDLPLLPNRLRSILVIFAASMCLYFIGWMLVVGILEHSPED
ncbi:capsule biosynthesis protein [Sphingomonas sp. LY160]|uniref:capsule biosynthesis protein n=1 Tax=Sphingomonas sp. LY160 TaxID=3095342 RepID=UPI002ADEDE2C|nr:capsule biosynthesis protein [Sphingomonas sp. LY160]MEA1071993.1 capsule biosynthesis protein [Sphingomonas sp. LY160]